MKLFPTSNKESVQEREAILLPKNGFFRFCYSHVFPSNDVNIDRMPIKFEIWKHVDVFLKLRNTQRHMKLENWENSILNEKCLKMLTF